MLTFLYFVKTPPENNNTDKFIISLHKSLETKFKYNYKQNLFSFIINTLLVIGFYINVKGGH